MSTIDGGPALFRLVRFWSRRWARGSDGDASHAQLVLTVEAIAAAGTDGSVGDVARLLGLDQSGASRMVAAAEAVGYVERARAAADARRSALHLTTEGHALLQSARGWQRTTFADLTASWPEEDRDRFAGYLRRLADQVGA